MFPKRLYRNNKKEYIEQQIKNLENNYIKNQARLLYQGIRNEKEICRAKLSSTKTNKGNWWDGQKKT